MTPAIPILIAIALGLVAWLAARTRAWRMRREARAAGRDLHSLPSYHAWYAALWTALPAALFAFIWAAISPGLVLQRVLTDPAASQLPAFGLQRDSILSEAQGLASGSLSAAFNSASRALVPAFSSALEFYGTIGVALTLILGLGGLAFALLRQREGLRARTMVERSVLGLLLAASLVAVLTTLSIFVSLIFETLRFFQMVNPLDFLFGTSWNPDPMAPANQGLSTSYGALPLFWGTVFVGAIIAMAVAIPLGLMSAIFLTQYATPRLRQIMKPVLEVLAGVPTVVYGYFAALTVAPGGARFRAPDRRRQRVERKRAGRRPRYGGDDHPAGLLDGR